MRISVQLPTENVFAPDEFLTVAAIGEMARGAEDAGFDACFVTDHPFPGDRWLASGGHHSLDPFAALTAAAAATTRLRLQTHVLVLPYRNPFMTAKSAATVDVLSSGRLIMGVATGYLEPEFDALGADFEARNTLSDQAIPLIRRAWRETGIAAEGHGFRAPGNTALPRPQQQDGPPIWVGGNSKRAIRRAVELGDGWLPFPAPRAVAGRVRTGALESLADLAALVAYARRHAEAVGRTAPFEICFVPFEFAMGAPQGGDAPALRDGLAELEAIGVTWLTLNVPCATRAEYLRRIESLAAVLL